MIPGEVRKALETAAGQWVTFSPAQAHRFVSAFRWARYPARATVAVPGRGDHAVFLIVSGLVRFYTLDEGTEANQHFGDEGDFVRAVTALAQNQPFGAQALEPSSVLSMPLPDWNQLVAEDEVFGQFGRRLAEAMVALKERRIRALQTMDAAGRYRDFQTRFPRLEGRVPQYHVASYLGITEVTLSRTKSRSAEG